MFCSMLQEDTINSPAKFFDRIREKLRKKRCREEGFEFYKVYTMFCCEDYFNPNYKSCKTSGGLNYFIKLCEGNERCDSFTCFEEIMCENYKSCLLRKYKIESLSPVTFPGALKIIRDDFCRDERVAIGCEVFRNARAVEELLELCADAALDGVSLVAVDTENGEVSAVAFNKIQVKSKNATEKPFFEIFSQERCTQDASRALVEFMANIDERCNLFKKYNVNCSLEIMFLGTYQTHRRQGLATLLTKFSIVVARKIKDGPISSLHVKYLGPKYSHLTPHQPIDTYPKICQAIWTVEGSQRVGEALNFTVHLTVPLSKFVFNGKTYSERIGDDSAFCQVAALYL